LLGYKTPLIPYSHSSSSPSIIYLLFHAAGLDPSKFNKTIVHTSNEADNYFAPPTEMDAEEKFKNAEKFNILCRLCGQIEAFQGNLSIFVGSNTVQ
jgi:hypothetical protein